MKVAVVYNRISQRVINLFGVANREKYGLKNIKRITDALKAGGHQVTAFEGDKDLIANLEEFMPRVLEGERPGLVFNLSYGIQGQARYTHVPGILEMVGIPYVGSGPLAHSLALDKIVAKMIFVQHDLPTPTFTVLDTPESEVPPDLPYPMIVKPKNEAVSFGIRRVENRDELVEAAGVIFEKFEQPVLVEQFIEGREINVGLLGNNPPEALPPVELAFGEGPTIYSYEDKAGQSGRTIDLLCPAPIGEELTARAQELAKRAFRALGCADCARVDMRIDGDDNIYLLEINSLPSLGPRGSYVAAAAAVGLDFTALCNRLVEVTSARYFGTPEPPDLTPSDTDPKSATFAFLTGRRDELERRLRTWTKLSSRTDDPVGIRLAAKELGQRLQNLGLEPIEDLSGDSVCWGWETKAGLDEGTLLLLQLDVPLPASDTGHLFRRGPELLHGEGIAISRAPLVMLEFAFRALRHQKLLRKRKVGVLAYADEGRECALSGRTIRNAAGRAARVLMLRSGNPPDRVVTQRRGRRGYELVVEGKPRQLGQAGKKIGVFPWFCQKMSGLLELSSRKERVAVAATDVKTRAFPTQLPHRVDATLEISYLDAERADATEQEVRALLGKGEHRWSLEPMLDRPPMARTKAVAALYGAYAGVAEAWGIPLDEESSVWPSAAGLVPVDTPVLCGVGPVGEGFLTPQECVHRISLVQRTLLLAEFLVAKEE